jgi:hypothetical protein
VPVTDEQRAMLQLLLEGGQGYDDIGSLLGIPPDEVRSRARSALTEIGGGADPDAQVAVSDYVLGQADPIGRADAVRHLQSDPEANALAQRLVQNLRLLAPKAELPEIPEPRGGGRATPAPPSAAPPPPTSAAPPTSASPPPPPAVPKGPGFASRAAGFFSGLGSVSGKRRTQLIVGVAAALALVIVIVVVATSGGSGGSSDCKPVDSAAAQQAGVPQMKLAAAGSFADADCAPSGLLTLGAAPQTSQTKNQAQSFLLQANAVHLPPTENNERYVLWLYKSDAQSVPLGQESVDSSGNLNGGVPVPAQELVLIPAFQTIRLAKVTSAQSQQIQQSLQGQGKKPTLLVPFVGEPVLQGNVADLGIQQLLQQAQSQAGASGGQGQATTTTGSKG